MIIIKGQQNAQYSNSVGEQVASTIQALAGAGGQLYSTWSQTGAQNQQHAQNQQQETGVQDFAIDTRPAKKILGMEPYVFYILTGVVVLGGLTVLVVYLRNKTDKK